MRSIIKNYLKATILIKKEMIKKNIINNQPEILQKLALRHSQLV